MLTGRAATAAIAAGDALPFLGGSPAMPLAFARAKILVRVGEAVAEAHLGAAGLAAWIAGLPAPLGQRFAAQRERLTRLRPSFAGLPSERWPLVMGIVNVTPDSFSDGGRFLDPASAIAHGRALRAAGATLLDVGGESTRPGAAPVPEALERDRVLPVIEALARDGAVVSVDTRRASVMRAALDAGARIVNDVTGLTGDPASADLVRARAVPTVLMHMQGTPRTMQAAPRYAHAALDVLEWCEGRLTALGAADAPAQARFAVDPGIGFGKTLEHNLVLFAHLAMLHATGAPVLLGASRKSFIANLAPDAPADGRLPGSLAAVLAALLAGVQIVRVHDVAETVQALDVARAILAAG
ncbi:MAG: dihydropteroate synthase [Alphaproteobacteria bacterium]|nr:dihydropteroate synthase [Alphaproteobacteria bacterium]